MDPFTALGVAANIYQFVEAGVIMINTVRNFKAGSLPGELDQQLEQARYQYEHAYQLKTVCEALSLTQAKFGPSQSTNDPSHALSQLSNRCASEYELLLQIVEKSKALIKKIEELKPKAGKSGKISTMSGLRSTIHQIWQKDDLDDLEKRLHAYRMELNTRLLAAVNTKVGAQGEEITEILSINRSIASWIQSHAAILTRRNGKSETIIRPADLVDITEKDATDYHKAIGFRRSPTSFSDTTLDGRPETTFELAFNRVEQVILNALRFRNIDTRQQVVKEAHHKTFGWIFKRPAHELPWSNFKNWLEVGDGIYWINGKAGSGKSTLMKYIANHQQLSTSLLQWAQTREEHNTLIIASFFIYKHGLELQDSQEGLLRALLYQILDQRRDLIPVAFPNLCHTYADPNMFDDILQLTLDELKIGLLMLSKNLPVNTNIFLMIDGLDEYTGESHDLIELVQNVTRNSAVKALVSSRPMSDYTTALAETPTLKLQELTKADILEYVEANLIRNKSMQDMEIAEPGIQDEIANSVYQKASGVFLWVVIVVRSLVKGLSEYDKRLELLERIDHLPTELEDLYDYMMRAVGPNHQEEASLMLQLVDRSISIQDQYPMTALQLSFALEDPTEDTSESIKPEQEAARCAIIDGRMRSRCCGLIECQTVLVRSDCCDMTTKEIRVAFLHRSVIDFFAISTVWTRVRAAKPCTIQDLDERLLIAVVRELKTTGFDQRMRCQHSTSITRHNAPSLRPMYTAVHGLKYSRSLQQAGTTYVKHLLEVQRLVGTASRRLYSSLEDIVNRTLPVEGFDLQGCLDYPYGFLLCAAANGLSDFVRADVSQRSGDAEISRLLLYLMINLHNRPPLKTMSEEERTKQRNRLSDSIVAILQSGINPNKAGLFWNDIETANVSEDVRKAVRISPNQQTDLVPWIYWLVCNDEDNDLLAYDRMLYYNILEKMLDAGADVNGLLGGQGKQVKQKKTIYSLARENLNGFSTTNTQQRALYDSVVGKLEKKRVGVSQLNGNSKKEPRGWRKILRVQTR